MSLNLSQEEFHRMWNGLSPETFAVARPRSIYVNGTVMLVIPFVRDAEIMPRAVYFETGLSFLAKPRFATYRHRFVLLPKDIILSSQRWQPNSTDVADWIRWSQSLRHVVLFSTFKSGASVPFVLHAQSIPLFDAEQTCYSSLLETESRVLIKFGEMPNFENMEIREIVKFPARGLQLVYDGTEAGLGQLARKVLELSINYDSSRAYNLLIVPNTDKFCNVNFFPRCRACSSIYGSNRWQIGSFEFNGLLQVPSVQESRDVRAHNVAALFRKCCATPKEYRELLELIDTF